MPPGWPWRGRAHRRPRLAFAAALLAPLSLPAAAAAQLQDPPLGLADDPFRVTDPVAAPPGEATLAFIWAYDRARSGSFRDTYGGTTEMTLGLWRNSDLRLGQSAAYGNLEVRRRLIVSTAGAAVEGTAADESGPFWGGATYIGALYQFADERRFVPAAAVLGRALYVYGPGKPSPEIEALLLANKTLVGGDRPFGVHLNLGFAALLDPLEGERPNRYFVNASVGQTVAQDAVVVASYVREQQERGQRDFRLAQFGYRRRVPALGAVLGLATSVGIGRDSPRLEVAFALQWLLDEGR